MFEWIARLLGLRHQYFVAYKAIAGNGMETIGYRTITIDRRIQGRDLPWLCGQMLHEGCGFAVDNVVITSVTRL